MTCAQWEERLALAVEGDLPLPHEHLTACASCREFLAALEESQAAVKALAAEPEDTEALDAIRQNVMARVAGARPAFPWWWVWVPAACAAALAVAAILWPREVPAPPERVAAVIPPAPAAPRIVWVKHTPGPQPKPRPPLVARAAPPEPTEPLLMRIVTDDPNVSIYWIVEGKQKGD